MIIPEDWDPFAQDRANKKAGKRRTLSMVVMEHLTNSTIEGLADSVGLRERTTNADRLLGTFSEVYSEHFNMKLRGTSPYIDLGSEPEQAEEILWAILRAADIAVDALKSKDNRRDILKALLVDIAPEQIGGGDYSPGAEAGTAYSDHANAGKSASGEGDKSAPWDASQSSSTGETSESKGSSGRNPKRDPLERKTLAPTDRANTLHVSGTRLPGIYNECRAIEVSGRPNAAAMLLRLFLELSCEAYLAHHRVRLPTGRNDWSDIGISLDTKIGRVLGQLDHDKKAKDLIDAHAGLSDDHSQGHSIRSLHRAMHDRNQILDPRQIKMAWQRWHPFLLRIHESIEST